MLKIIIFNVEDGFCSFIRSPKGHIVLYDCGRSDKFSAVKYVVDNELAGTVSYRNYRVAVFILSHPHQDHLLDIERMERDLKPSNLARNVYDWEELKQPEGDYSSLDAYVNFQKPYTHPTPDPDLGMDYKMEFGLSVRDAKRINESNYVNNSSIPLMISYKGWKIFYPGDLEKDGWLHLLENSSQFCDNLRGTHFFVTSHHGHSSGYCSEVYDVMGKPYINIVSAQRKDESVEQAYSTEDRARGIEFGDKTRYMLSTRNDGSIFVEVNEEGKCTIRHEKLKDNIF